MLLVFEGFLLFEAFLAFLPFPLFVVFVAFVAFEAFRDRLFVFRRTILYFVFFLKYNLSQVIDRSTKTRLESIAHHDTGRQEEENPHTDQVEPGEKDDPFTFPIRGINRRGCFEAGTQVRQGDDQRRNRQDETNQVKPTHFILMFFFYL